VLPPAAYLAHLDRAAGDVAALLADGDLTAPVPGCPGWRLLDLAHHLRGVHRWARTAVVEGRPGPDADENAPTQRAALVDWFRTGAADLAAALGRADPDAPCWTFGPRPRTAVFWIRRQAHETAMHAHDAATSQGGTRAFAPDLAADGVDEVVTMFVPRQLRLDRIPPLPAMLALEVPGARWVLGDAEPAATVTGPAEAVLLLLWRRTALDDPRLAVTGPRAAAEAVLGRALTP
jgi:uncharacterized protein (TIGR03083 family)